ncbi:MAG TPA: hypothetical protein VEP90_30370, partial [Methylomirabilota bacterium]|nr:hypothetical protein [Methylomirabilota bacterium]
TRLMYANETLASKTIPNTDTIIRSYSGLSTPDIFVQPPDLTYPYVIVEAEGYITTNLITSTRQDISIMIEDTVYTSGSPFTTTIVQTIKINPEAVAASGKIPFAIKGADNILLEATYGYGVESINVIAPAADANTVANIVSMRVYVVENSFLSIPNMPIPLTEIYGSRIGWSVPFTTTYTPFFCINIIVSSWNASSTIIIQSSTDQTAWTTRSNIFINTIGISCVQTSIISLTAGTIYFRLASQSGGGIGDFPAISGIILTFTYSSTTNVPVGYGSAIILSLTSTSFKIKFQFDATITASNTITFNWRSIGS